MRVYSGAEQGEDEDFEAHFGSTDQSGLHCEKFFENTFPTEHYCSQKKQKTSAKHHLKKEQDSNGGPKDKPSHANTAHTTNSGLQNYFLEMFPRILLSLLSQIIFLLSQPLT